MDLALVGSVPSYNYAMETIQVANNDSPDGFVIINKADFDPAIHVAFVASDGASKPTKASSKRAAAVTTTDAAEGASDGANP